MDMELMIKIASKDLDKIKKPGLKASLKETAKKAMGRNVASSDLLFWPAGLLLLGLSECALRDNTDPHLTSAAKELALASATDYIKNWKDQTGEKISFVDDALSGVAMINLFARTGQDHFMQSATKIATFLHRAPKNIEESIIYNPKAGNDYIFADGAGQSAMFLSYYGFIFHKTSATKLAAKQLLNYYNHGIDKTTGLPYHAFSLGEAKKLGLLGWGRAMGWLLMGYSEYVATMKITGNKEEDHINNIILSQYKNLVYTTLSYQRLDGGFSWLLPAVEGEPDTSATAMIGYAIALSLAFDLLPEDESRIRQALLRMKDFVLNHTKNGQVNQALSSCEDLAVHRQVYGHFPWGQGAALAFLSIMNL